VLAIRVNSDGLIYLAGDSAPAVEPFGYPSDALLASYTPAGDRLTEQRFSVVERDTGEQLALGPDGSLYVGLTFGPGSDDISFADVGVAALDASGNRSWVYRIQDVFSLFRVAMDAGPDGAVYIATTLRHGRQEIVLEKLR
jgi:hypothetical protein